MTVTESYLNLLHEIVTNGGSRETRNHPTTSVFGQTLKITELSQGLFPLIACRKMHPKGVLGELAAFLKGATTLAEFEAEGCNYWKQWADDNGSLRIDYGTSWRNYNGVDQVAELIKGLREDPAGRRHVIDAWRPDRLSKLSLPCCHFLYQWYVNPLTERLEMTWYQRSVDVMVGLPSDIILAATLNILVANEVGLEPGEITMMLGDTHIYHAHASDAHAMLYARDRDYNRNQFGYSLARDTHLDTFSASDLEIRLHHPAPVLNLEVFS